MHSLSSSLLVVKIPNSNITLTLKDDGGIRDALSASDVVWSSEDLASGTLAWGGAKSSSRRSVSREKPSSSSSSDTTTDSSSDSEDPDLPGGDDNPFNDSASSSSALPSNTLVQPRPASTAQVIPAKAGNTQGNVFKARSYRGTGGSLPLPRAAIPTGKPLPAQCSGGSNPFRSRQGSSYPSVVALAKRPASVASVAAKSQPRSAPASTGWFSASPPSKVSPPQSRVDHQVPHPLGIEAWGAGETLPISSNLDFMSSGMRYARHMLWSSVQESTKKSYSVGWKHFQTFVILFGTNVTMTLIPECWDEFHRLNPMFSFQEAVVMSFLSYMRMNVGVEPKTAFNYMAGVRLYWMNMNVDVRFLEKSPAIKAMRQGMTNAFMVEDGSRIADRIRLPVSLDVIEYLCKEYFGEANNLVHMCAKLGVRCTYVMAARTSEMLVTKSKHYLRAGSVYFTVMDPATGSTRFISAPLAYQFALSDVLSVQIDIKDAKNDQGGQGHRSTFEKRPSPLGPNEAFCICTEMFQWASLARHEASDAFFSYRQKAGEQPTCKSFSMSARFIVPKLKKAAAHFGLPPKRVSMHSLRIGCASAMAAANIPHYTIQIHGRWKSLAFLSYIRLASQAFQRVNDAIINVNTITADHVKLWCAAVEIPGGVAAH